MHSWLNRRWYGDSAALALRPLSWAYGAAVSVRRRAYAQGWLKRHDVGRPVVVVGNLTVGGTGKTPLVAWLARQFSARGYRIGIVSRGYGRAESAVRFVEADADWRAVGDEPLLLKRATACLTVVAADRVAGARALVECGVDAVIADDGLQHLRLARACEIAVVDGARGFGNGHLLPAGPLREPVGRLASVDLIVVNGSPAEALLPADVRPLYMRLALDRACAMNAGAEQRPLEAFRGQPIHAVAGIGNPARFFRDLRAAGLEVLEHAFADHHAFTAGDLEFHDGRAVLMTEKDAVKCRAFANPRHWFVPVTVQFGQDQTARLLEQVRRKLGLAPNTKG